MTRALCLALALVLSALPVVTRADEPDLQLEIFSPASGAVIGDPGGMAFVSGKALALFGAYQAFDIMFVIDTSESTAAPSGADVDGDGAVGERRGAKFLSIFGKLLPLPNSDRGDSILAAEIEAVHTMLDQLDPRTTRVGIVAFSGDHDPLTPDGYTEVPLTTDFRKVADGLENILDRGPGGLTNMVTAVNLATSELMGMQSAFSEKREHAKRIMMFLTDGFPTLPIEGQRLRNAKMAIRHAVQASKLNIRIDTFAIGEDALSEPVVVVEMARVSDGVFTPVLHPQNLQTVFEEVNFAEVEALEIRNRTTKKMAAYQLQNADGTFSGLVPVQPGRNTLEVYVRATDGTESRRSVTVNFMSDATPQELGPRDRTMRNRLMENRLLDLQQRRLEIETDRDEQMRKDLKAEIEAEREKARKRSEALRKQLQIQVEEKTK
ncbi:MAG: VWA domain-containing protein [bacterium]|nr:VWA domain-containing protein [bacterium]